MGDLLVPYELNNHEYRMEVAYATACTPPDVRRVITAMQARIAYLENPANVDWADCPHCEKLQAEVGEQQDRADRAEDRTRDVEDQLLYANSTIAELQRELAATCDALRVAQEKPKRGRPRKTDAVVVEP